MARQPSRRDAYARHTAGDPATSTSTPVTEGPDTDGALQLYRECVEQGIWARLVMEMNRGGQSVSFSYQRAAATTAAVTQTAATAAAGASVLQKRRRKPNERRLERYLL
jgi:hypothetical protein